MSIEKVCLVGGETEKEELLKSRNTSKIGDTVVFVVVVVLF